MRKWTNGKYLFVLFVQPLRAVELHAKLTDSKLTPTSDYSYSQDSLAGMLEVFRLNKKEKHPYLFESWPPALPQPLDRFTRFLYYNFHWDVLVCKFNPDLGIRPPQWSLKPQFLRNKHNKIYAQLYYCITWAMLSKCVSEVHTKILTCNFWFNMYQRNLNVNLLFIVIGQKHPVGNIALFFQLKRLNKLNFLNSNEKSISGIEKDLKL